MATLNQASLAILSNIETINLLRTLPSTHQIPPQLASIFLGVDERTLARYRMNGTGPVYIQAAPAPGSKALNQKVAYKIADLIHWQDLNKVHPRNDVSFSKQFEFRNVSDLSLTIPFVYSLELNLVMPIHLIKPTELLGLIDQDEDVYDIGWMQIKDCLEIEWSDLEIQEIIRLRYVTLLHELELTVSITRFRKDQFPFMKMRHL